MEKKPINPWDNIKAFYDIRGDGVAVLNLSKARKSKDFKAAIAKLREGLGL